MGGRARARRRYKRAKIMRPGGGLQSLGHSHAVRLLMCARPSSTTTIVPSSR